MVNHPNRNKKKAERAVLVTTAHKGVFFGYAARTDGATIRLRRARNCIYWPATNKGFLGLAAMGPVDGAPGTVEKSPGPLDLCAKGTLHATLVPPKWKGERWWIVALIGKVVGDDTKFGALEREILGEAT